MAFQQAIKDSRTEISQFTYEKVLRENNYSLRKTKIVCTIGPACWEVETLCKMLDAGMNVARLNFSHGDHKGHKETLDRLKDAFKLRKSANCAIMLDTKGPEIRTGLLKDHKNITLKKGQQLEITTDYNYLGDEKRIACSYPSLTKSIKVGNKILIADGSVVCTVLSIFDDEIVVTVLNDATLGEKKNMNLPGVKIDLPTVTAKDEDDIVNFALKYGIDMIALSFTRTGKDIEQVRDLLGPRAHSCQIIAKIENQEGLQNFQDILEHTDGVMVARGDLGMEIPPQKVFVAQKWLIKQCNEAGKPVITATQMMESMIKNPRPTRAEASDVANAVLDGTDTVMLSGETANGSFPIECLGIMSKICREAEMCYANEIDFWGRTKKLLGKKVSNMESLAIAAVQMSFQINSPIIVIFTILGEMPRLVSKYRPLAQIIAVSNEHGTMKALTYSQGVRALRVPSFDGNEKLIDYAVQYAKEMGYAKKRDKVVVIVGCDEDDPDTNDLIKIKEVQ